MKCENIIKVPLKNASLFVNQNGKNDGLPKFVKKKMNLINNVKCMLFAMNKIIENIRFI